MILMNDVLLPYLDSFFIVYLDDILDHHPVEYLQDQSKLQQTRHYKWMGFLQ
jgi:hypothetical protein